MCVARNGGMQLAAAFWKCNSIKVNKAGDSRHWVYNHSMHLSVGTTGIFRFHIGFRVQEGPVYRNSDDIHHRGQLWNDVSWSQQFVWLCLFGVSSSLLANKTENEFCDGKHEGPIGEKHYQPVRPKGFTDEIDVCEEEHDKEKAQKLSACGRFLAREWQKFANQITPIIQQSHF